MPPDDVKLSLLRQNCIPCSPIFFLRDAVHVDTLIVPNALFFFHSLSQSGSDVVNEACIFILFSSVERWVENSGVDILF